MQKRKSLSLSGKRGNVTADGFLFLIILFGFAIMSFIGYYVLDVVNTDIQAEADFSNTTKETVSDLHSNYPATFDSVFAIAFALMWLLVLIASWLIDSNPLFFAVTIILLVAMMFVSGVLTNTYEDFVQDEDFGTLDDNFPITNYISGRWIEIMIMIGLSISIVLYGKVKLR